MGEAFGQAAAVTPKETLREGYIWLDDLPVPGQDEPNPMLLREKQNTHEMENISFDFRTRDSIVVSARRSRYKSKTTLSKHSPKHHGKTAKPFNIWTTYDISESDSSSSGDEDDNEAEETCSEGSTDLDSDEENFNNGESESDESSLGDDDASTDSTDEDSSDDSSDSCSSYDEDGYPKPNKRAGKRKQGDGATEGNLTFDEEEGQATRTRERPARRLSERASMINASLSVYDIRSGQPVRLFHFQQDLPVILYSSPPTLHPSKSLVAWPLGGGDVLFADYLANTYFIRGAVPNTQDSE